MLVITGTYPPRKCGVGDYCQNLLSTSLTKDWKLYTDDNWSISTILQKFKAIKNFDTSIINIQYPTVGYGTSLLPHILAFYITKILKRKLIVTIHEYSQLGWKGQLAASIFFRCADNVVFTTEFERQFAQKKHKYLQNKSSIIKIYSNITINNYQPLFNHRTYDIGYFGYIRPDKGLEDFINAAKKLQKANPNLKIYIMGQTQDEYSFYHQPLLTSLTNSNITLFLNKDNKEVSEILANTKIAYLPYPDGLTERRGSFLAALLHHCVIVTTIGNFTTKAQLSTFNFVNKENSATKLNEILNSSDNEIKNQITKIDKYINSQVPKSWDDVAIEYLNCIKSIE